MSEWVKSSGNIFEDLGFDSSIARTWKSETIRKIALEKAGKYLRTKQTL